MTYVRATLQKYLNVIRDAGSLENKWLGRSLAAIFPTGDVGESSLDVEEKKCSILIGNEVNLSKTSTGFSCVHDLHGVRSRYFSCFFHYFFSFVFFLHRAGTLVDETLAKL